MPLTDIDAQRLGDSVGDKLGNRNLVINGAMTVAQRSTSSDGTSNGYYTVDIVSKSSVNSLWNIYNHTRTDGPDRF